MASPERALLLALALIAGGCGDDGGSGAPTTGPDPQSGSDADAEAAGGDGSAGAGAGEAMAPDPGDLEGPWQSLAARGCPPDNVLSYESFGAPFFLNHCQGCHGGARPMGMRQGAPVEVSFDDVDAIRALADRIWLRAADQNDTMPPVGPPPAEERRLLGEWLACGAP